MIRNEFPYTILYRVGLNIIIKFGREEIPANISARNFENYDVLQKKKKHGNVENLKEKKESRMA